MKHHFTIDTEEACGEYGDDDLALAFLILDGRVNWLFGKEQGLYVNCNDIFAWGCADAERMAHADVQDVLNRHLDDPDWGTIRWCCVKRQSRPQPPIEKRMREAGVWDEEMEALPVNTADLEVHLAMTKTTPEEYEAYAFATLES